MGGLLAAVGIVALFLLAGGSGGAKGKGAKTKCLTVDDLPEPLRSEVKKALATETDPAVLDGVAVDIDRGAPECGAIAKQVRDRAAELRGKKPGPAKKPTAKFNAKESPSPGGAHSTSTMIGLRKAAPGVPDSDIDKTNGTYNDPSKISKYEPAWAASAFAQLQKYAGITVDGKYGPETKKAFSYWFYNTTRPDGTTDERPIG